MNDLTKLEFFAAYLPYSVGITDVDDNFDGRQWMQILHKVNIAKEITENWRQGNVDYYRDLSTKIH